MLALRKTAPGFGLSLDEIPDAFPPGPGEVVVKVEAAGICGSDVHAYEWTGGYEFMAPHMPFAMGHEFAGTILRNGTGGGWEIGQRVAVIPFVACGVCARCRAEGSRNCLNREGIGLTRDGGFAKTVRIPARCCVAVPGNVDAEIAALAEPLGVGLQAVLTAEVALGDTVLVMGPGTIGQAIALAARAAGATRVLVSGRADAPRFDVLRQLGFNELIDVAEGSLQEQVMAATGGRAVDVVLEATGVPATLNEGLSVLKKGGVLAVVGIHAGSMTLPLTDFVRMRHQLRASNGAERAVWDKVMAMLGVNPEQFRPMITHRLPLSRGIEGFELARQRAASKVMLTP
jgi:threonine dehydrogenase-like Zn-dependent dehydrogenase